MERKCEMNLKYNRCRAIAAKKIPIKVGGATGKYENFLLHTKISQFPQESTQSYGVADGTQWCSSLSLSGCVRANASDIFRWMKKR